MAQIPSLHQLKVPRTARGWKLLFAGIAACAAMSALFPALRSGAAVESIEESRFDRWFDEKDASVRNIGIDQVALPEITLSINEAAGSAPRVVVLDPRRNDRAKEQVLRVLRQIREAHLLEDAAVQPKGTPPEMEISIVDGEFAFRIPLSYASVSRNMKATLALKLFELYGNEQNASALAQAPIAENGEPAT